MRRPAQVSVESEIFLAKEFGDVKNLACMQREVLHYVIDSFEDCLVIALHPDLLGSSRRGVTRSMTCDGFVERASSFDRSSRR